MAQIRSYIAASSANILNYILSLPDNFKTRIGEGGSTLSSGQAQRIAIARAVYKEGLIFIFDEPTANLDTENVEKIQSIIKNLSAEKICIVVTHDEDMMKLCGRLYVFENKQMTDISVSV